MADETGPEPSEEQLAAALEQLKVSDLLVQSLSTISSLASTAWPRTIVTSSRPGLRSTRCARSCRCCAGSVPDELVRDFEQVTANLQLAYADAVSTGAA